MKTSSFLACVALSLGLAGFVRGQIIDTRPGGVNPSTNIGPFGEQPAAPTSGFATLGETFRAPTGFVQLNRFTFWLRARAGLDGTDFAAYVSEWDAASRRLVGPLLYSSDPQLLPFASPAPTVAFAFDTGGLLLDPSKQYVAFLSASHFFDGSEGNAGVLSLTANTYADGAAFFINNLDNFSALYSQSWTASAPIASDLALRAEFSAIPEPSTYGLIGAAFLTGAVALRRRKRA
jgi:hypothetical protein